MQLVALTVEVALSVVLLVASLADLSSRPLINWEILVCQVSVGTQVGRKTIFVDGLVRVCFVKEVLSVISRRI